MQLGVDHIKRAHPHCGSHIIRLLSVHGSVCHCIKIQHYFHAAVKEELNLVLTFPSFYHIFMGSHPPAFQLQSSEVIASDSMIEFQHQSTLQM